MFNIYWEVERKCRRYSKLVGYYPLMLVFVGAFFYSIYCIHTENYDTSTWILPYRLSVPFDTKEIWGWYLLWFMQANIGFTYSTTQIAISSHFMSCCFYIGAICDHFDHIIGSIQNDVHRNRAEENPISYQQNCRKYAERLSHGVGIHIKAFE